MSTIEITNILRVSKAAFDPYSVAAKFTHANPKHAENRRLGFSNWGVPETIKLYAEVGDAYIFPRGLISLLRELNPDLKVKDSTVTSPVKFSPTKIILKDFQVPVVEAMLQKNQGLYVAPPGSGKTVAAIEVIVKRGQKSLVLVHTKDLQEQWCQRFKDFTDIEPGFIAEGQWDVKDVTIAMVQSLNRPLDSEFVKEFGLVCLDEAHHAPAVSFNKIISAFHAKHRFGITATPSRRDSLEFILFGVIGPIIYQVERDSLFQNGEIIEPFIKALHTNFYLSEVNDYGSMITALTEDAKRNNYILKFVAEEARDGHSCLVLSERIEHVISLWEQFCLEHKDIPSIGITSRSSKKMRDAALREMRQGKFQVLFSTKLADEGLDIRRLDRLFLTCPIRSVNKVNQQIGRILRKFPGKKEAVVFDFRDSLVSLAESQYHTRLKQVYRDFDVMEIPYAVGSAN